MILNRLLQNHWFQRTCGPLLARFPDIKSRLLKAAGLKPKTIIPINIADTPGKHHIYYWIDHTCTNSTNSGIQRVTRGLARGLQQMGISLIPIKWDNPSQSFYSPDEMELLHLSRWNGPEPDKFNTMTEHRNLLTDSWLLIPELTSYGPELKKVVYTANRGGLKTAIIFYDTIPYKLESFYSSAVTRAHVNYMKDLINFDLIFPISHTSCSDLQAFLNKNVGKLTNIENKLKTILLPGEFHERPRVLSYEEPVSDRIRILCVSTIEPRKNHLILLEAFNQASNNNILDAELILVGSCAHHKLEKKVMKFIESNSKIQWLRNIDDTMLAQEYSKCHFTVYPSPEEGFGLPILESLWYGKPCICRNAGAMAEAAEEGGCLTIDTTNTDELTKAISHLAKDKMLRAKLGEEAITRKIKTWSEFTIDVLNHLNQKI